MHRQRLSATALAIVSIVGLACAPPTVVQDQADRAAPDVATALDESTAMYLAALPLACLDRPHSAPRGTGYLYDRSLSLRMDYERTRAFYGCYDWHSAVNSTWTLAEILNRFPEARIGPLIVEKFDQHLTVEALAGEVQYFEENPQFERPYGWAWLLALDGAIRRSPLPNATDWSAALAPLSEKFASAFVPYLESLDYPLRVGTHRSTAFAMDLVLDYSEQAEDLELQVGIRAHALRLFGADRACGLAYEPSASDFLSPCLETAKLMTRVLNEDYSQWLDAYLGPLDGPGFQHIAQPILLASSDAELDTGLMGAKSHLIGLAFTRAEALERAAAALPAQDPRVEILRNTATTQAEQGFAAMFEADYLGSHWLATFALKYLLAAQGS